ncbi:MAG: hypothetical protein KIT31_17305 [Deltaproteobacteria bacterium]|nr:hypothetical protein [Deltaproteobacteria bacterium]
MTTSFYESNRTNTESRWDSEVRTIVEPALARYTADPAKLRESSFSILYQAVLAWGPERITPYADRIAPLLGPAFVARAANEPKSIADLGVGQLANLLACCGYPDETPAIREWLREIRTSSHDESTRRHWERAFAALALDVRPVYRALGGADPKEPLPLEPSRAFGGNVQGLVRYLGAAVEHHLTFAAVEPAWRELLGNFDRHESSRQLFRDTLFWIGRVVHHRIGGAPLGSVAEWVHEQVVAYAS